MHYADLAALMVMLDMKPGGGVMDAVNEAQKTCASTRSLNFL